MTLTALIIVNAILDAAVVYGIASLLAFGIKTDRPPRRAVVKRAFDRPSQHRLAA